MSPDTQQTLIMGLIWAVSFIASSTCHEAAHAWAAKLGGDLTAYEAGQVSLDPWPHIRREPMGMVFVPLLSFYLAGYMFGWASAPYDPVWAHRHPKRAAWMALAGPLANLALVLLGTLTWHLVISTNLLGSTPEIADTVKTMIVVFTALNLLLFCFNLIPVAPLDGGQAIVLLFPERMAQQVLAKTHALGGFGIIAAWCIMSGIMHRFDFFWLVRFLLS